MKILIKESIDFNEDFRLDWHDPDEATDGYQLKWIGKDYARLQAGTQTETVIIPDIKHNEKDENKNSQNLFFTGDNLEVLKHLQNAYSRSVNMIYIDPPYNTGKEFIYSDEFEFSDEQLENMLGLTDDEIKRLHSINGRSSHSAWLTFMYPRLKIARKLLTDDGIIFISIDDNEQANLKLICDEIFGEANFITEITWQCLDTIKNDAKYFSDNHEYILCYSKVKEQLNIRGIKKTDKQRAYYKNYDNDERGDYLLTPLHAKSGTEKSIYTYTFKNGQSWTPPKGTYPRFSQEKLRQLEEDNRIFLDVNGINVPQKKTFWSETGDRMPATTFWGYAEYGSTRQSNKELAELLSKGLFQNPKPTTLIRSLCDLVANNNNLLILDFFAGSATTAHAVMQLNSEDNGNRKFIMVQLPEPTQKESEAKKAGFNTIDEISRKRIENAATKINQETNANIDYGFKHYIVKNTEVKTISKIIEFNPKTNFIGNEDMVREFDNENSSGEEVILTTWLVDDGYKLDTKPEVIYICGYKAFYIDNSALYLIFQNWRTEQTKELLNLVGNHKINLNTIILYGYSFDFESLKELETNIKQNFNKRINIEKRF